MGESKGGSFLKFGIGDKPSGKASVPLWAKVLFAVSVAFIMVGLVVPAFQIGSQSPGVGGALNIPAVAAAALTGDQNADGNLTKPDAPMIVKWPPNMFRVGFGFFVAFTIAFALRSCLRMAVVALAFFFITGFGLQHEGLVDVKWDKFEEQRVKVGVSISDRAKKASEQSEEFLRYLPPAAAAALGLVAGFMRRRS